MTVQIKISPFACEYIRELHQRRCELQSIVEEGLEPFMAAGCALPTDLKRFLETLSFGDEMADRVRKLEQLVRWHKMLVPQAANNREQLAEVEEQIFALIGEIPTAEEGLADSPAAHSSDSLASFFESGGIEHSAAATVLVSEPLPTTDADEDVPLSDLLVAFEHLRERSQYFLGETMTSRYLKSSRPDFDWLQHFKVDPKGNIQFSDPSIHMVGTLELYWTRRWMHDFIASCSQIIQDFPSRIDKQKLAHVKVKLPA
jgi:hypothetical protein